MAATSEETEMDVMNEEDGLHNVSETDMVNQGLKICQHLKSEGRDKKEACSTSATPGCSDDAKVSFFQLPTTHPIEHIDELPSELFRKILGFLRYWEQSRYRTVSKYWNEQILNFTSYTKHSYILITFERLLSTRNHHQEQEDFFSSFDPLFRNMRIIRISQSDVCASLRPSSFAETLVNLDLFQCGPMTWPVFLDLLISCPGLEELRVRKCPFKWPYDLEEWRNKYVEWLSTISKAGNRFPNFKAVEFRVKDPHDVLYMWKLVSTFSTRLGKISFACKTPPQGLSLNSGIEELDDMYEVVIELNDVLVEMVSKFAATIDRLHCYLIDSSSPHQHHHHPHPRHHAPVEKADLSIMNQFCSNVLARLDWDKMDLRSFCLSGGEIAGADFIPKETSILANFLKSQKNLEKVILPRIKFPGPRDFDTFASFIPSGSVRSVRTPIFGRMPDAFSFQFQRLEEYYVEAHGIPDLQTIIPVDTILPSVRTFSFVNFSDRIWQTVKIMTIVNSFPCLSELLIRDDGVHQCTRISDTDVQNICRYLPSLKKLHLTNVDCVTDFGFTGICEKECKQMNNKHNSTEGVGGPSPGTKLGYSFSTLSHLEYLFLSDIGFRVTNVSLVHGFSFPNLRFMTLEGFPKVSSWGIQHLRKANPNLKRWHVEFHDPLVAQTVEQLQMEQMNIWRRKEEED